MKNRFMVFVIVLFIFFCVYGEETKIETLKKKRTEITLNGGLSMKFSALGNNGGFLSSDTDFAYILGFKAEVVFNKSWYLGGAAYFLGNKIEHVCDESKNSTSSDRDEPCKKRWDGIINQGNISLGYGGLSAGYTFNIKSFFRTETGFLIGGGRFSNQNKYGEYFSLQSFFVLEPEINFLLIITKFLAVSINFSYRLITGMDSEAAYSTSDMSGPTIGLDIRLGSF